MPQTQDRRREPIGASPRIALEHAAFDQRLRKPAHRRRRQPGPLGELSGSQQIGARAKRAEYLDATHERSVQVHGPPPPTPRARKDRTAPAISISIQWN
jgi:hypothetical protein